MTLSDWVAGGFKEIKSWFKPVDVVKLAEDSYNQLAETADLELAHPPIIGDLNIDPDMENAAKEIHNFGQKLQEQNHIEFWMDICLQLVASGEITQERLYSMISEAQKIDLEDYAERKRNQ